MESHGQALHHELVVRKAVKENSLSEDDPVALFFDVNAFKSAIVRLQTAFGHEPPEDKVSSGPQALDGRVLHTLAVKSNPTLRIMQIAYTNGIGFETASLGELTQALKVAKPSHIVFDSPVKTRKEIRLAMASGVHLNVDNLTELERVSEAVQSPGGNKPRETDTNSGGALHTQFIGVRINPQVGAGSIATHSTSTSTSKFGVPLLDMRDDLIAAYRTHTWLNAIHVHVGSQGVAGHLAVAGIKAVVDFAIDINRQTNGQIKCVDIGGGLSVNFGSDAVTPTFQEYADLLRKEIPQLFDDTFSRVLTEFGRSLTAKAGWFGSRIEYTKNSGGRHIAAQHCGADLCIRTIYHPEIWPLRVSVLDTEGFPMDESQPHRTSVCTDIAGPCCIAGDIIAHERQLPQLHAGDFVVVHDVGGYYMASYSRYNCRQAPPVIGYNYTTDGDVQIDFEVLQKGETVEQSLDMFNRY